MYIAHSTLYSRLWDHQSEVIGPINTNQSIALAILFILEMTNNTIIIIIGLEIRLLWL